MNLADRFWQHHLINRLMSTYQAPDVVDDETRILTNITHDIEHQAWRRDMEQAAQNRNFSRSPVTLATNDDAERYRRRSTEKQSLDLEDLCGWTAFIRPWRTAARTYTCAGRGRSEFDAIIHGRAINRAWFW